MCLANIEHPAHICSYVVTDAGEVCSICEEPKPVQEQRPSKKRAEKINQLDYCRRWLLGEVDKGRWSNEKIAASVADVLDYFRAADEPSAAPPKGPSPEWLLKARAEGRAEFLTLLLDESAETFSDDFAGSHPIADTGDYGCHWKEDELRELFKVDEAAWSLIDNLRGTYWEQQAKIDDLERASEPPAAPRVPDTFGTDPNDYAT